MSSPPTPAHVYQTGRTFLLTRHQKDDKGAKTPVINQAVQQPSSERPQANTEIAYWGWTEHGPARFVIKHEPPLLFVTTNYSDKAKQLLNTLKIPYQSKDLSHQTFSLNPVTVFYFYTLDGLFRAQQTLKQGQIETFEHDLRLQDKYLIERKIQGAAEFIGIPHQKPGYVEYQGVKFKPAKLHPNFKVISLDIECSMEGDLYSIGLYGHGQDGLEKLVIMIGNAQPQQEDLVMVWVKDEYQLLLALEHHIQRLDPDIIIGWNVINFDFRLLMERAKKQDLSLRLGRGLALAHWRDSRTENNQGFITLPGRVVIDGIDALRTATYHFESFSLEYVAQALLARGKKTDKVDQRAEQITYDFQHNKLKLAAYNLEDCKLVWDIFEHTELIDFLILRSEVTGLELDKVGGSVAAFTNLYLPKLHRSGYIAPNLPPDGGLASPGGYVMSSKPGLYKNVLVLDFKSLYPSIIRTFKIDPMGLIEGLKHPEHSIPGFKGAFFSRDKHFLPDIITQLWKERDQAKGDNDGPRSQAIKIIMNSFYGVLGSGGCRFYDTRLASSITMRGHQIMQQTAHWIEQQTYSGTSCEVIYGDTDSTFVLLDEHLSAGRCNEIGQSLADLINKLWREKLQQEHQLDCHMELEFETHYQRFLMPTIRGSEAGSKKRYAGLVVKNEQPKMVFKGLETVRTDWTDLARDFQKNLYQIVFDDRDPSQFIKDTVAATLNGERDNQLIYRKRLRRPLREYVKNVPPHARSAKIADEKNKALGKPLQYQHKGWINYIITLNGPEPLDYLESDIDYQHYLEKQLKPIAEGILPFIGMDFDRLIDNQMALF